jgi:hypothetical protein
MSPGTEAETLFCVYVLCVFKSTLRQWSLITSLRFSYELSKIFDIYSLYIYMKISVF